MSLFIFFFFTCSATPEIHPLSLHDALPICLLSLKGLCRGGLSPSRPYDSNGEFGQTVLEALRRVRDGLVRARLAGAVRGRSEEHTSELQSHVSLVCRLLLEKKKHK